MNLKCRLLAVLPAIIGCGLAGLLASGASAQQSKSLMESDSSVRNVSSEASRGYSGYGGWEQGGFPASDWRMAVDANARTVWARQQYHRSQEELGTAIRNLQLQFEASAECTDMVNAEKQAYDDLLAARKAALQPVFNDPAYKANVQMRQEMAAQIAELRYRKDIKAEDLVPYALAKLGYAAAATAMEANALLSDTRVRDAQDRLVVAGRKLADLRARFDLSIRTNPELVSIRKQVEDLRISFLTASAFRDGAVFTAEAATAYSYHRDYLQSITPGYGGYLVPLGYRY